MSLHLLDRAMPQLILSFILFLFHVILVSPFIFVVYVNVDCIIFWGIIVERQGLIFPFVFGIGFVLWWAADTACFSYSTNRKLQSRFTPTWCEYSVGEKQILLHEYWPISDIHL